MKPTGHYEKHIWWEGFWCAAVLITVVEIVAGFLWMIMSGSYPTP